MYSTLLIHQWKKSVRSRYFSQGWGMKIMLIFLSLYFGLSFLGLGFLLPNILERLRPEATLVTPVLGEFIFFYILTDLALRFFLQDLTLLSVQHYLLQKIGKSKIIHFLLSSSIFNIFNFFPLLLILPFAARAAYPEFGATGGSIWLLSMLGVVLIDHFLAIYLKRAAAVKQLLFIGFAVVVVMLFVAHSMNWISLSQISQFLFGALGSWWLLLAIISLVAILYLLNYRFLKAHSYIDRWKKSSAEAKTQSFSYLESRGIVGSMMATELKLILRNKRTRSILVMTLLFCAYGLLFYTGSDALEDVYSGMGWRVFAGIFMTGIFMINYGQFMLGWEGAYFDGILTRAYPMAAFFKAKFWLLVLSTIITYLITLLYGFLALEALWINTACFLYNIGVNSFILLYASTYQKKTIDLTKSSAFNYQGTSVNQFVVALPLILLPILIFQSFNVFDRPYYGLAAVGVIGLISLAFSKYWFAAIVKNFEEKKYRNAAGFREG